MRYQVSWWRSRCRCTVVKKSLKYKIAAIRVIYIPKRGLVAWCYSFLKFYFIRISSIHTIFIYLIILVEYGTLLYYQLWYKHECNDELCRRHLNNQRIASSLVPIRIFIYAVPYRWSDCCTDLSCLNFWWFCSDILLSANAVDPDLVGSLDPYPDPGGQKWPTNIEKS
jgi:hypothetical protein